MKDSNRWSKIKHWIDVPFFIFFGIIVILVWRSHIDTKSICPPALWEAVTTITKDAIQTGIIATSILLPACVAVLGFLYYASQTGTKQKTSIKDISTCFLHASGAFLISLGLAVYNMTHLPFELQWGVHIAYNSVIFLFAVGQFVSFFLGIWKMLLGGIYIRRIIP